MNTNQYPEQEKDMDSWGCIILALIVGGGFVSLPWVLGRKFFSAFIFGCLFVIVALASIVKKIFKARKEVLSIKNSRVDQEKGEEGKRRPDSSTGKSPSESKRALSQFAHQVRCAYCFQTNNVPTWPPKGDYVPFYCQTKERTEEAPGGYRVGVHCSHCGKDWFVVWDNDPR